MTSDAITFPFSRPTWDPPAEYARLREDAPVACFRLWDGRPVWLVTRYEDVRTVLTDHGRFSSASTSPGYPSLSPGRSAIDQTEEGFTRQDPPQHDVHRRMLAAGFTVTRIEALRPHIRSTADRLIDELLEHERPADLVDLFALPLPSLVICRLLGVPYVDHEFFQTRSRARLTLDSSPTEAAEANAELADYLLHLVEHKEDHPADDLASRLAVEQVSKGNLTRVEAANMLRLVLIAGHETTSNQIALSTLMLLERPDVAEALRRDHSLIPGAVEELLRYFSVTQFSGRRIAVRDTTLGGQLIREGEGVIALVSSANRDEGIYADANTLKIERVSRNHLAFGHGVHFCLGHALARVELQTSLAVLLTRLPALQLAESLEQLQFLDQSFTYGLQRLLVTW